MPVCILSSYMCLQEKTQNYESLALGLRAAELPTEEKNSSRVNYSNVWYLGITFLFVSINVD